MGIKPVTFITIMPHYDKTQSHWTDYCQSTKPASCERLTCVLTKRGSSPGARLTCSDSGGGRKRDGENRITLFFCSLFHAVKLKWSILAVLRPRLLSESSERTVSTSLTWTNQSTAAAHDSNHHRDLVHPQEAARKHESDSILTALKEKSCF